MRRGLDADREALRGGVQLSGSDNDCIGGEGERRTVEALSTARLRNDGKWGRRHVKPRMEDALGGLFEEESQVFHETSGESGLRAAEDLTRIPRFRQVG